jgi:hypothetical protein
MRLVRINAPEGRAGAIAELAFKVGIKEVNVHSVESHASGGSVRRKESVDIATATPTAKAFLDALLAAPFYNCEDYHVTVRHPRSILSALPISETTYPLVEPGPDLLEELWQFSHVTPGFIGRVLLGAGLLGFGLLKDKVLLVIGGLLFLPLLPMVLGISFGTWTREWALARRALFGLLIGLILTAVGAAAAGWISGGPCLYHDFLEPLPSAIISAAVGLAAALATADDVGRRELIGLAAAAQIAVLPAWLGIYFSVGGDEPATVALQRALTLALNLMALATTALVTYAALRFRSLVLPPNREKSQ